MLRLSLRLRLLVTDSRGEARLLELGEPFFSRSLDLARVLGLWGIERHKHHHWPLICQFITREKLMLLKKLKLLLLLCQST